MRLLLLLPFLILSESVHSPIAIRHDVADSLYIQAGAQYPSVVRVGAQGGDGTLIAPDWVLTAGHVASGMLRRHDMSFQIWVDGQESSYAIRQIVIHPDFVDMGPNDIALIRLERVVEGVQPVPLYRKRDEQGKHIVLVGHGDTKSGQGGNWIADGIKRAATNVVDEANDRHIIFDFDAPGEGTELEGTAGPGDSGGPAFILVDGQPHVAGISSLGSPGRNGPGTYGAHERYARVSSYLAWIEGVLANPPEEKIVRPAASERRVRRGGPGAMPPGVVLLEAIGLLVSERQGFVQMVGRIDELYPSALLDGGIRPPARLIRIDEQEVTSVDELKAYFDKLVTGTEFALEFEHQGEKQRFELVK